VEWERTEEINTPNVRTYYIILLIFKLYFIFSVEALKGIARKLNKTDWDFSVDPCIGSGTWVNSTGFIVSNVTCDCSFQNHTNCHIISL
jgi:hypothetical protein